MRKNSQFYSKTEPIAFGLDRTLLIINDDLYSDDIKGCLGLVVVLLCPLCDRTKLITHCIKKMVFNS